MYWRPIKFVSESSATAAAEAQWKQITPPHDRLYRIQALHITFTTSALTFTGGDPSVFVRCKDVSVHPASSSDVLWEVIAPVAQAASKTYYYHVAPNVFRDNRDTDAIIHNADRISFRIPETVISTGQSIEIGYAIDTGGDVDLTVCGLLDIAGQREGA